MKICEEPVRWSRSFIQERPLWWINDHVLKVHGITKGKIRQDTLFQIRRHYKDKHEVHGVDETTVQMDPHIMELMAKLPRLEQISGGIFTTQYGQERWGDKIFTAYPETCSACLQFTKDVCTRKKCNVFICDTCYDKHGQKKAGCKCWKHLPPKVCTDLCIEFNR